MNNCSEFILDGKPGSIKRLDELNISLNLDKRENEIVGGERDEDGDIADSRASRSDRDCR